jgi:hypothetical protein
MPSLTRFDWDGTSRPVANVWTLTKSGRPMTCSLVTHPIGWELRLRIGSELFQSELCRTEDNVFDVSGKRRSEAEAKGWAQA